MRTGRAFFKTTVVAFVLIAAVTAVHGRIIYVDDDAPVPGDGASWTTAYRYLQDALADANGTDEPTEIRIAQGIYKPDQGANQTPGDIEATFHINRNLVLVGSFAGTLTDDPNHRDLRAYGTTLTGDLEGNDREDLPEPLVASSLWRASRADNSLNVLIIENVQSTVVLDGVSITAGACSYCPYERCRCAAQLRGAGGGIYSTGSTLLVRDCTFTFNSAADEGGALFCEGSDCRVESCTFYRNYASNGLAGEGGAIASSSGRMVLVNSHFIANFATSQGGAIHGRNCDLLDISNCLLAGNMTYGEGTAISALGTDLDLTQCTIAADGPGYALFIGADERQGAAEIANCILSTGGYGIDSSPGTAIRISYSDIWPEPVLDPCDSVVWGEGNIHLEPAFARPGYWNPVIPLRESDAAVWIDGDYHLKSQVGRWDPNSESWVQDDVTSPCIDAGDPNSNVAAEVWPHGGRINMGAYGGTAQASMSVAPTEMFLPRVVYVHWWDREKAESFQSFLQTHGCPVTLLRSDQMAVSDLEDCDLVMIDPGTQNSAAWPDQAVSAITDAGTPILGLGPGGYRLFGKMGLTIGYPNGASNTFDSVQLVDPNSPLLDTPYAVAVPQDSVLTLYHVAEKGTVIYLWPAPGTVTTFANMSGEPGYFPLVAEQGHFLWGFTESPEHMTAAGQRIFLNAVIRTANGLLEPAGTSTP